MKILRGLLPPALGVRLLPMRGVGLLSCFVVSAALGACSGKSSSDDDDNGGSSGENSSGSGGKAGASTSGSAGTTPQAGQATNGGSGGGAGKRPTQGGSGGNAGAEDGGSSGATLGGGAGRAGNGGSGGASPGGMGGAAGSPAVPETYLPPGEGDTWQIPTGDPLNSTVPVLAPADGGVVIAGASADPATVGLSAFDDGILSEAFVARLDATGKATWSVPLKPAGLPWAVAKSGSDYVVVAPNIPDQAQVSTSFVSQDLYLAKVSGTGTIVYEKTVPFEHEETFTYGMAVAPTGEIYLAGGILDLTDTGIAEHPILVKVDASGQKIWDKPFTHPGTQAYANAVIVLPDGDVVITGDFDNTLDFGGSTDVLTSTATLDGLPSGFIARFNPSGDAIWSQSFGGDDFSTGMGLAALPNGDFFLAASVAADLNIGTFSLEGEPFTPSDTQSFPPTRAFIARLNGAGEVSWVKRELDSDFANVVATDGKSVFLGGAVDDESAVSGAMVYLRSYSVTGETGPVYSTAGGEGVSSAALALSDGALWVSGRFTTSIEFDNTALANADAGVFLARLKPAP